MGGVVEVIYGRIKLNWGAVVSFWMSSQCRVWEVSPQGPRNACKSSTVRKRKQRTIRKLKIHLLVKIKELELLYIILTDPYFVYHSSERQGLPVIKAAVAGAILAGTSGLKANASG